MSLLHFDWALPPGVRAAFTIRSGGVSHAPWDTFNIASHVGDATADVDANRRQLREMLALPGEPGWLNQEHGVAVCNLDSAASGSPVTADAAIASVRGRVCVVMVADCLPVLFASRDGQKIAAAHAGWRGLAGGVIEQTVTALKTPGRELTAWLGPAISAENFEVGDDVRAAFIGSDPGAAAAFAPNSRGRWQADLAGLARRRLAALGIAEVSGGTWCTFGDRERFFSHRRDGHLHAGKGGRMAALIWRT